MAKLGMLFPYAISLLPDLRCTLNGETLKFERGGAIRHSRRWEILSSTREVCSWKTHFFLFTYFSKSNANEAEWS